MYIKQKQFTVEQKEKPPVRAYRLDDDFSGEMRGAYGVIKQDENDASLFHIDDGSVQYDVHVDEALVCFDKTGIHVINSAVASNYLLCTEDGRTVEEASTVIKQMSEPLIPEGKTKEQWMTELKDKLKAAFYDSVAAYPQPHSTKTEEIIAYLEANAPSIINAAIQEINQEGNTSYSSKNIRDNIAYAAQSKMSELSGVQNFGAFGESFRQSEENLKAAEVAAQTIGEMPVTSVYQDTEKFAEQYETTKASVIIRGSFSFTNDMMAQMGVEIQSEAPSLDVSEMRGSGAQFNFDEISAFVNGRQSELAEALTTQQEQTQEMDEEYTNEE